jgi:hypothetical protein
MYIIVRSGKLVIKWLLWFLSKIKLNPDEHCLGGMRNTTLFLEIWVGG